METLLDVLVPLGSVLVGAAITYYLNVRQRRCNRRNDLFDEAVEAVSVGVSSMSYVPGYGKWHRDVTKEERIDMEKEVAREAAITDMRAIAEARNAVAKRSAYAPALSAYLDEPVLYFQQHPQEIVAALRTAQVAAQQERWALATSSAPTGSRCTTSSSGTNSASRTVGLLASASRARGMRVRERRGQLA